MPNKPAGVWPSTNANGIALIDPITISHQGRVLLFARQAGQPVDFLYYNVIVPTSEGSDDAGVWQGWNYLPMREPCGADRGSGQPSADRQPLLRVAGIDLISVPPVAVVPKPADSAFRVVTDGKYISCFRVSKSKTIYIDRFILVESPAAPTDQESTTPQPPVWTLNRAWEIRYRRSEVRDSPSGNKDTLDSRSMTGEPFLEPTMELALPSGVTETAGFAVVQAPTLENSKRWHFFTMANNLITATSFPQDGTGRVMGGAGKSFTIAAKVMAHNGVRDLTVSQGVAATIYQEQEEIVSAGEAEFSVRRAVRLMIAATVANAALGLPSAIAVYDFLVQPDGTIPAWPADTAIVAADGSFNASDQFVPATNATRYPVPVDAVHVVGKATAEGVLLGQPRPAASPALLDSSDGLVHCYFAGQNNVAELQPFLVAQMDPKVTRATVQVPWTAGAQTGNLGFVSQRSGTTFNQMMVTIADCPGQADLCNIAVDYGAPAGLPRENWTGVPRSLRVMGSILNGTAASDASDSRVKGGGMAFFDYSGTCKQARLPLTDSAAPTGFLTLVSRRADVALDTATVSAVSGNTATLKFSFTSPAGAVEQTWASVPLQADRARDVLSGDETTSAYSYTPAGTDTKIYGLTTGSGTILLLAKSGAPAVKITTDFAANLEGDLCNLTIEPTGGAKIELTNVSRKQEKFIAALVAVPAVMNLFSYLSADPLTAEVANQVVEKALDLRGGSTLFTPIAPGAGWPLVAKTVTATILQGHKLTPAPVAPARVPNSLVAVAAIALSGPEFGLTAMVGNASASVSTLGQNGAWMVAEVPKALSLNGQTAVEIPLTTAQASLLTPGRHWTIETWCNPSNGSPSRILSYNNGLPTVLAGVVPAYFIGSQGLPSLLYEPYTFAAYASSYVNIPADPKFNIAAADVTAFTWEAFVNPQDTPGPATGLGAILEGLDPQTPEPIFQLGLKPNRTLSFGYLLNSNNGPQVTFLNSPGTIPAGTWTHTAVTGQKTGGTWTFRLYINAAMVASVDSVTVDPYTAGPFVAVGASDPNNSSVFGNLAEIRFWTAARTTSELKRTMNTSLTGYEPSLYGYWPLVEKPAQGAVFTNRAQITLKLLDGHMQVNTQKVTSSGDGAFVSIVAGVGGAPAIEAQSFLRANHWNHIAVVYEACGAVNLNLGEATSDRMDYGKASDAGAVTFATQNSVESWVQIPATTSTAQTILAQWGDLPENRAFQFSVTTKGFAECTVQVVDPKTKKPAAVTVTGTASVCDSKPHHLVVTWAVETTTINTQTPVSTTACTITLYVDSAQQAQQVVKYTDATSIQMVASTAPLTLGISSLATPASGTVAIETQAPFVGVITGLRFWSTALTAAQVMEAKDKNRAYDKTTGVVSAWWFDEDTGLTAAASVGTVAFKLSNTDIWTAFASIATMRVYGNGLLIGRINPYTANDYMATPGCTIGAYRSGGTTIQPFMGNLVEVRVWKSTRSENQLREAMYHSLVGDEDKLQAYWKLDNSLVDDSGHGNNGTAIGAVGYAVSTAPVSNEGAQVRNVYGGVVTDFQETLQGTPSVLEYGDADRESDQTLLGVLRRCYFYNNPGLVLSTKYSVGELDLIYVGQAQTNPTLIGYIEGAPPVPSENLTRPLYLSYLGYNGYADASTVSLTQAAATQFTFSSSDYQTSFSMDVDFKLGFFGNWEGSVGTPFFSVKSFGNKLKIGVHTKENLVRAKQNDTKYQSSWTRTSTDVVGLRGFWEPAGTKNTDYLNPEIGRRFQPDNIGYALVESLTADIFAMRMKSTRATIGRIAVPNLGIPIDRNVLLFKIKPGYTKNGTLDGKVGFVDDPSFPSADFERRSYFNPSEAYDLKTRIDKQEKDLQVYFDQFDAQAQGEQGNTDLSGAEGRQFYDFKNSVGRKSIVNNYVWNAMSGLYKNEEQVASAYERVFTGFYNFSWSVGPYVEGEFAAYVGVFGGLDLLFGGQTRIQVAKGDLESRQFGLTVTVPGEPFLASYKGDGTYSYEPTPGKVLSYRFMSFFLPPAKSNADAFLAEVIDDTWLKNSADPDAIALRGAKIEGNSVWRVLHRVTYVARIPPVANEAPAQTPSTADETTIILDDNLLLIQLVQAALGVRPPTPANIGAALAAVLAPTDGSQAILGQTVPWWQKFIDSTKGQNPDAAALKVLGNLLTNTLNYLTLGYATGVLPVKGATAPTKAATA